MINPRFSLAALSAALLLACAAPVQAEATHWVDSTGASLKTGTGGCWSAMNGASGSCTVAKVVDSDNDGVADSADNCPNTPAGAKVDANGCPLDSDHDGVADYMDKCPSTPAGAKVDANGCVAKISFKGIKFAVNKAELTADAKQALGSVVPDLVNNTAVKSITLTGYTDSTGSAKYNMALSKRRADAAKDYLASQGIAADKIKTVGMGEADPVADNATAAGRADNRRVELNVKM